MRQYKMCWHKLRATGIYWWFKARGHEVITCQREGTIEMHAESDITAREAALAILTCPRGLR